MPRQGPRETVGGRTVWERGRSLPLLARPGVCKRGSAIPAGPRCRPL